MFKKKPENLDFFFISNNSKKNLKIKKNQKSKKKSKRKK